MYPRARGVGPRSRAARECARSAARTLEGSTGRSDRAPVVAAERLVSAPPRGGQPVVEQGAVRHRKSDALGWADGRGTRAVRRACGRAARAGLELGDAIRLVKCERFAAVIDDLGGIDHGDFAAPAVAALSPGRRATPSALRPACVEAPGARSWREHGVVRLER